MKRLISYMTVISMVSSYGAASEFYIVRSGETLSQIVRIEYPSEKLYGSTGKIAEVLKHNPQIKNSDRIFPNQKIIFVPKANKTQVAPLAAAPAVIPVASVVPTLQADSSSDNSTAEVNIPYRKVSENPGLEEWNISALYGAKYLSISQSGAQGKADIGVLFLNDLKVNSEFLFNEWALGFQIDSYKFSYESVSSGGSKQMYALNLFGGYKWFLGGLNIEQNPLFRNNAGNIELEKMTVMSLSLGARKDIELPTRKPTAIKLKGWIYYPLSSSTENTDVKTSSLEGYGVQAQAELSREIFVKEGYSLHANWMTEIGIRQLNQNVEWSVSKGETKSAITNASTTLGLLFKF